MTPAIITRIIGYNAFATPSRPALAASIIGIFHTMIDRINVINNVIGVALCPDIFNTPSGNH